MLQEVLQLYEVNLLTSVIYQNTFETKSINLILHPKTN